MSQGQKRSGDEPEPSAKRQKKNSSFKKGSGKGGDNKKQPLPIDRAEKLRNKTHGVICEKAKGIWNKARSKSVDKKVRAQGVTDILALIGDVLSEVVSRHDSSRIVQFCIQFGTNEQRTVIIAGLKKKIVELSRMPYGRFVVQKMFDYCKEKKQRKMLMSAFEGQVSKLSIHSVGAHVLEYLFLKALSPRQSRWLFQEFFGPEFRHFKQPEEACTLKHVLEAEPEKKADILTNLERIVTKHAEKGLLSMSFVQDIMCSLFEHSGPETVALMTPYIKEAAPAMCTTRKGVVCLVKCIAHASAKDRKKIIKCFKDDLLKDNEPGLAQHPFAHLALLKLFDVVDDTVLLSKAILSKLLARLPVVCSDRYARKLLLHLLSPRNARYFTPSDKALLVPVKIEVDGKLTSSSKKDPATRQKQLLEKAKASLEKHCISMAADMLVSDTAGDVLQETLVQWESAELIKTVVEAAVSPGNEDVIPICQGQGHRLLQRIISKSGPFALELCKAMCAHKCGLGHWAQKGKYPAFIVVALLKQKSSCELVRKSLKPLKLRSNADTNPGMKALVRDLSPSS